MKKVIIALASVLIIIVIAVSVLLSNIDGIIQDMVEEVGSKATASAVTLGDVEISLTDEKGSLKQLVVANPKGFETPNAFELGAISVKLGPIDGDQITISEVLINAPKVTYELSSNGSNIDAIQQNVDRFAKQFASESSITKSESGDDKAGPKIIIEKLMITGGEVSVSAGFLKGKTLTSALPDITLTDIGKENDGASSAEVVKEIIDAMTKSIGTSVGSLNLDGMMKDATKAAGDALKSVGGSTEGVSKSVTEGVGAAGDKLKKLFGN